MTLGEKIRTLRKNNEWTQAQLAERLFVSPDSVQKYEVDKNTPPTETLVMLAGIFDLSAEQLLDESFIVYDYILLLETDEVIDGIRRGDSRHQIFDAALNHEGRLHRFENNAGEPMSAIYHARHEQLTCPRSEELFMIRYWNMINR